MSASDQRRPHRAPPVIGLAGGIGAGKSAAAQAFARLGCAVIDSDKEAKAALDRPDVRDALRSWWGAGVIDPSGRVDRPAVAKIVFADPAQRARLERLIHPLIRRTREAAQKEALAANAPAIIYDAPLLFEAGIDASCDAVVWVHCPRDERLRRVRASRGWDEAELARREASQWPEDDKRRRCGFEIDNGRDAGAGVPLNPSVDAQAARVLAILLHEPSDAASDAPGHPPANPVRTQGP